MYTSAQIESAFCVFILPKILVKYIFPGVINPLLKCYTSVFAILNDRVNLKSAN